MTDAVTAPETKHVIVIGAGIGGLVSALLLSHRGLRVTLLEAAATPGGKMRRVMVAGQPVDSGPTVFTMRWVFEQIFASVGASLSSHVQLSPLNILARHAWRGSGKSGDQRLDLHTNIQQSTDAIAQFSSPAEAQRFTEFCAQAKRIYQHLEGPYIRSSRPNMMNMGADLGPAGLAALASLGPFASLWSSLGKYFHDPRLQQLFGRYATYCGASPWLAPATLMLVAHVELDGVYSVHGGMNALAVAIAKLAEAQGALLRYGCAVKRILTSNGKASGVELANGEQLQADAVVFNGDASALSQGLLGDASGVLEAAAQTSRKNRSLSAVTWSVNARTSGFPLVRHNVFFEADYQSEFTDIFQRRRLPAQGTVYVCAQDRDDTASSPDGTERLLLLVNAPPDGDINHFDSTETQACQDRSLQLLAHCGLNLDMSTAHIVQTTPSDFNRLFPGTGGALYGQASHGWMTPFQRSGAASHLPGLYLAGGSVHPGPGVPMAALSGQLAAETLMAHLVSTKPLGRVRISGGTSTPSATTANTRSASSLS
jgi:1-hydroxycarotenoid 3,4-desaturase